MEKTMIVHDFLTPAREIITSNDRVRDANPLRRRSLEQAVQLGNAGLAAAEAECLNNALMKLVELCYQEEHGKLINIDEYTGRINQALPVPWNSRNFKRYGLRRREQADVLRWVMLFYSRKGGALFEYNPRARRWHVNLAAYPACEDAMSWLRMNEMTGKKWLQAHERLSERARGAVAIGKK